MKDVRQIPIVKLSLNYLDSEVGVKKWKMALLILFLDFTLPYLLIEKLFKFKFNNSFI